MKFQKEQKRIIFRELIEGSLGIWSVRKKSCDSVDHPVAPTTMSAD